MKKSAKKKPTKLAKKPKRKINSRTKGKVGELEFAQFLKDRGIVARRGQQFKGGSGSPDVVGLAGFHIEVKRTEAGNLYNWMHQACTDANPSHVPIVAHRKNNKNWVIILDARDFINMVREVRDVRAAENA
jgi:Holliday junction resolvase